MSGLLGGIFLTHTVGYVIKTNNGR